MEHRELNVFAHESLDQHLKLAILRNLRRLLSGSVGHWIVRARTVSLPLAATTPWVHRQGLQSLVVGLPTTAGLRRALSSFRLPDCGTGSAASLDRAGTSGRVHNPFL
jgi:hypothetical protein